MRSTTGLAFCALLLLLNAVDGQNPCLRNPCQNKGQCFSAAEPGLENSYICRCTSCYGGKDCELRTCDSEKTSGIVFFSRLVLLGVTGVVGVLAFIMFFYRLRVVGREKEIPARRVKGTRLVADRVTRFGGKESYVLRPDSSTSMCSYLVNSGGRSSASSASDSLQRAVKSDEERLRRSLQRLKFAQSDSPSMHSRRRFPAWDEIEMRRHGLVDKHCDRIPFEEVPSNPPTITTTDVTATPTTSMSAVSSTQASTPSAQRTALPASTDESSASKPPSMIVSNSSSSFQAKSANKSESVAPKFSEYANQDLEGKK